MSDADNYISIKIINAVSCPSISSPISLSISLSISLPISLSISSPISLPISLSIYLPVSADKYTYTNFFKSFLSLKHPDIISSNRAFKHRDYLYTTWHAKPNAIYAWKV